jgi:hypothetical protein
MLRLSFKEAEVLVVGRAWPGCAPLTPPLGRGQNAPRGCGTRDRGTSQPGNASRGADLAAHRALRAHRRSRTRPLGAAEEQAVPGRAARRLLRSPPGSPGLRSGLRQDGRQSRGRGSERGSRGSVTPFGRGSNRRQPRAGRGNHLRRRGGVVRTGGHADHARPVGGGLGLAQLLEAPGSAGLPAVRCGSVASPSAGGPSSTLWEATAPACEPSPGTLHRRRSRVRRTRPKVLSWGGEGHDPRRAPGRGSGLRNARQDSGGRRDGLRGRRRSGSLEFRGHAGLLAGEVAAQAVRVGDTSRRTLKTYEKVWHRKTAAASRAFRWGIAALRRLSDAELDGLFEDLSGRTRRGGPPDAPAGGSSRRASKRRSEALGENLLRDDTGVDQGREARLISCARLFCGLRERAIG